MTEEDIPTELSQLQRYAIEIRQLYAAEKAKTIEVTAAKRQLEAIVRRLVAMEKTRDEFVANCSHELRTPLVPIIGWAKVMERREVPYEQVKEFAAAISSNGEKLLGIVESLLAISQIHHGHERTLKTEPIDLGNLILEVAKVDNPGGWRFHLGGDNHDSLAMVHKPYVEKIVSILFSNVFKFTPPESSVQVSVEKLDDQLTVSIADQGPGVPEHDRDRIFEAFVQGDGTSTREFGGLGAGLFIARELVNALGGRIWVEDAPDGGAKFRFTLPQRRASDRHS